MTARCLRCEREFIPRRRGHVFCSSQCRHRGPRRPDELPPPTDEELARLFDDRPDTERVAPDDWFPMPDDWRDLYAEETLGGRRRWFRALTQSGDL